jgi:YD repeat-containing protein
VTRYEYDRKDRMVKRTDASGKIAIYQYDGNDNLVKRTDRKGQVTTYQYDANDRLASTTYNDGKVVIPILNERTLYKSPRSMNFRP